MNIILIFHKKNEVHLTNYRQTGEILILGKILEWNIKIVVCGQSEGKAVIGRTQNEVTKNMSYQTNLISFYNKVTKVANQRNEAAKQEF